MQLLQIMLLLVFQYLVLNWSRNEHQLTGAAGAAAAAAAAPEAEHR